MDCLLGFTFGWRWAITLPPFLILPVILFTTIEKKWGFEKGKRWIDGWQLDVRALLRRLIWIAIGISVYFTLPVRALFPSACQLG